jgi:hypothetical protein
MCRGRAKIRLSRDETSSSAHTELPRHLRRKSGPIQQSVVSVKSVVKLFSPFSLLISPTEEPAQKRQNDAHQNAGGHRKIERVIPFLH